MKLSFCLLISILAFNLCFSQKESLLAQEGTLITAKNELILFYYIKLIKDKFVFFDKFGQLKELLINQVKTIENEKKLRVFTNKTIEIETLKSEDDRERKDSIVEKN